VKSERISARLIFFLGPNVYLERRAESRHRRRPCFLSPGRTFQLCVAPLFSVTCPHAINRSSIVIEGSLKSLVVLEREVRLTVRREYSVSRPPLHWSLNCVPRPFTFRRQIQAIFPCHRNLAGRSSLERASLGPTSFARFRIPLLFWMLPRETQIVPASFRRELSTVLT